MARKNTLTASPPYAVDHALRRLGDRLRTARLRRNLTVSQVAERIGTGPRAVMDVEKGRPGASAAAYVALLWLYDLTGPLEDLADPALDSAGLARLPPRARARAKSATTLDNDF
jgi:transcriptional regulator with XRE-family HTH domain